MPEAWLPLLRGLVSRRATILITGGTGTGKTTLMKALLAECGASERIVTVEEVRELGMLGLANHVSLVSREANVEGNGRGGIAGTGEGHAAHASGPCGAGRMPGRGDRRSVACAELRASRRYDDAARRRRGPCAGTDGSLGTYWRGLAPQALAMLTAGAFDVVLHLERRNGRRYIGQIGCLMYDRGSLVRRADRRVGWPPRRVCAGMGAVPAAMDGGGVMTGWAVCAAVAVAAAVATAWRPSAVWQIATAEGCGGGGNAGAGTPTGEGMGEFLAQVRGRPCAAVGTVQEALGSHGRYPFATRSITVARMAAVLRRTRNRDETMRQVESMAFEFTAVCRLRRAFGLRDGALPRRGGRRLSTAAHDGGPAPQRLRHAVGHGPGCCRRCRSSTVAMGMLLGADPVGFLLGSAGRDGVSGTGRGLLSDWSGVGCALCSKMRGIHDDGVVDVGVRRSQWAAWRGCCWSDAMAGCRTADRRRRCGRTPP